MKKFIAVGLTLLSMNVFSQSYLVLNNGVTLTLDKAGFVYDFNNFRLPYKVRINGGQFLVEDKKLSTVDASGYLYEKDLEVEKVKGAGLNYFINDDNHLITIDSNGFYYKFETEAKTFKKTAVFGGNFFIATINKRKKEFELYTVNDKGNYSKIVNPDLNTADITKIGGKYFQTIKGVTYTVDKNGFVYAKPEIKVGRIVKTGGNFFIDNTNKIFTVSDSGFLLLPILPMNIKVTDIQKVGANYMIDSQGRIFTVDSEGNMHERKVDHDLTNAKILSL